MNRKILDTKTKLLRLFRPQQAVRTEQPAGSIATPGPRTSIELNQFDQSVDDAINAKRLAGQTRDPT